ncbi:hypothetical protein T06_12776 [Trichinella sp. T6]|nr:hypothetical protein T06_12776 [Trichinella sp. T6]
MVRWGSGSKPLRNKPLIYKRAAKRGIVSKTMKVSELARVECECCDDTNVEDGNKKTRPREPAKSSGRTAGRYNGGLSGNPYKCLHAAHTFVRLRHLPGNGRKRVAEEAGRLLPRQGVPTIDYGAVGRYLLTDSVRRELYPARQATDDSFEELKERLLNAYGLRVAGDVDRPIPCSAATRRPIHPAIRPGGGRAGVSERDLVTRFSGDPAAGTADPRGSSKAGHEDNPGGGRLPGEATAPRRRREDREDGDGPEDRRHDKGDGDAKKVEQLERAAPRPPRTTPGCFRCGSLDHLRTSSWTCDRTWSSSTKRSGEGQAASNGASSSGRTKNPLGPVYEPDDQVWMQVPEKTKLGAYWDGPYAQKLPEHWDLEVLTHSGQREPVKTCCCGRVHRGTLWCL